MRIDKLDSRQEREFLSSISYSPTGAFRCLGQMNDYLELVACVGYDHWTPNSVQMHIWIPRPQEVSKRFYLEGFRYPFAMCGRGLVIGITPSNNAAALHFNRRVGFKEVYRMKDAWEPGVDFVVQEMRKEDCRWLRSRHELVIKGTKEDNKDFGSRRRADPQIDGRIVRRPAESVQ